MGGKARAWRHLATLGRILLAACATGCVGDDQGSAGTTADTTDGEELPAICACLDATHSDPWPFACGATNLCPFGSDDPVWVTCALEALRDRTPGLLSWDGDHTLLILADGRGIARSWKPSGACYAVSEARLGDLDTPEWYDACLARTDLAMRRACATDLFTGDVLCAGSFTWYPGPECW